MYAVPLLLVFAPPAAKFPYHQAVFNDFVADSYRVAGRPDPDEFFRTMDERGKTTGIGT